MLFGHVVHIQLVWLHAIMRQAIGLGCKFDTLTMYLFQYQEQLYANISQHFSHIVPFCLIHLLELPPEVSGDDVIIIILDQGASSLKRLRADEKSAPWRSP